MARVRYEDHGDGRRDIFVTPDPALFEIKAAMGSREKRRFDHKGSLLDLILGLRAMGVSQVILSQPKRLQLEREIRARGCWDELKHLVGKTGEHHGGWRE